MVWVAICPKCGATLIVKTDGTAYCPNCHEVYRLEIRIRGVKYEC